MSSTNKDINAKSEGSQNTKINADAVFQVFQQSNIVIIIWFLAIYFVVYLLLNIFRGKADANSSVSRWVDIVSLIGLFIYLVAAYFTKSDDEKKRVLKDLYNGIKDYMNNPLALISVGFFILTLYIVIYILSIPMDSNKPIIISLIENGAWLFFVIILITTFLNFTTKFSLTGFFDNISDNLQQKAESVAASLATTTVNGKVKVDASAKGNGNIKGNGNSSASSASSVVEQNEVFNVGNNMYTYDDAQSVCVSMGARLATYDEVEAAYNNGAEWCNYGWSDGQAAYFPTQKETWSKLQKSSTMKNSCGRPGVNGGYIENPDARFGVNCYGKKPIPKESDLKDLGTGLLVPKTPEEEILDKKVAFWKANSDKLIQINSYNSNKWSAY